VTENINSLYVVKKENFSYMHNGILLTVEAGGTYKYHSALKF